MAPLTPMQKSSIVCLATLLAVILSISSANAETHYHQFVVQQTPVKRLCKTHNIITVNGQFPGPTLEVRDGDTLIIKVVNSARYNVTLHWHGIRQMRTPWADGPEYVTQCPIQPGASYTYRFTIENQDGTLWWHAHSRWLRATVYGALIIYPKLGVPYPFPKPTKEIPVLLGEWWDRDIISVLRQATFTGAAPNVSDAYTINGQPGDLYRCSSKGRYYIATRAYATAQNAAFDNTTATAILEYDSVPCPSKTGVPSRPLMPILPRFNDTATTSPLSPPVTFDYTSNVSRRLWQPRFGTKLYNLKFGSNVQIVLQDTAIVTTEDHPIHLHGYHFYVVGQGFGNFNPSVDTARFNLIDPPVRNTINVPVGGWAVIRFVADNPGVWLMHCHIDSHLTWGLAMAFLVENGPGELQSIEAPPPDLPPC
ncbi:UNVERIFIED_CONTAM: Laccase-3 [Sesamum radiatum]|uniref:Laccase-3 n=1 Tax=Sesamum radiatum TaxID=300843 RepID=A0AAW2W026_SESRA